jgi:hypothetical protein
MLLITAVSTGNIIEQCLNKMAYRTKQHVILVKRFYQTANVVKVQRQFILSCECKRAVSGFTKN